MKRIDNSQKVNLPDLKFTPQLDMEMKPYYQKVKKSDPRDRMANPRALCESYK